MLQKLIFSYILGAVMTIAAVAAAPPKPTDPLGLAPVVSAMSFEGVSTEITWMDCGTENAFYFSAERTVVMCNETLHLPAGVIRYLLAHELAHGVISQRRLPISWRWGEYAADELAVLILVSIGRVDDVYAAAEYWADHAIKYGGQENPFGDHPGHLKRAVMLRCLAEETSRADKPLSMLCGKYWDNLVRTWVVLLDMR